MTDLFWPGDQRAGDLFSDAAFLAAMVATENAWLRVLTDARVAPATAKAHRCRLKLGLRDPAGVGWAPLPGDQQGRRDGPGINLFRLPLRPKPSPVDTRELGSDSGKDLAV